VIAFNVFQGLYYGVRSALFMDVTTPAVAATQFTAYMAMSNLVITYTSWWQGLSIVSWGYPVTLVMDSRCGPGRAVPAAVHGRAPGPAAALAPARD
jgi:PAT family beta-lactamase induction signal transducer AmpG